MIRVLIAEDMHLIRGALVALLRLEDDMEVVAEAGARRPDPAPRPWPAAPTSPSSTSTCPDWTA
jgi:DNA-binding NarL/FixJ family response regulator